MAINHFDYISEFTRKFKKTRVLNEEVDEATYQYLLEKDKNYADFIKNEGFCSYEDGLFSIVNPLHYKDLLDHPNVRNRYGGDVIIKTGFGDFIYSDLKYETNSIHHSFYNENYNCGSKIGYLLTSRLTDNSFQKDFFKKKLFRQAVAKYGALKHGQNFSFPMDFPWAKESELEKIDNVIVYETKEFLKLLIGKHA